MISLTCCKVSLTLTSQNSILSSINSSTVSLKKNSLKTSFAVALNSTRIGVEESLVRLKKVKATANEILSEFFFKDTVDEWIEDKIEFWEVKVKETLQQVNDIIKEHF